ncbi:MAG: hypothetical protein M3O34_04200 [Chloroflexota bacterium]|nr:hypothetical protein [Chloroflexota bacterium]
MPMAVALFTSAALLVAPLTALPVATQTQRGEGQGVGVTADDILDNPRQYYGQQVTVAGEVAAILGPRSFVMLAGVFAPPAEGMIPGVETADIGEIPVVVTAGPDGPPLDLRNLMERVVRVTGTVHQFNLREFEEPNTPNPELSPAWLALLWRLEGGVGGEGASGGRACG